MASHQPLPALIYSFVARDDVVLCEYSAYAGNFKDTALDCLKRLPPTVNNHKHTYTWDRHTLNYLVEDGLTYMVFANDAAGKHMRFAFLDSIKSDFKQKYADSTASSAKALSLADFAPTLKRRMQHFSTGEASKDDQLTKAQEKVKEVKSVMMENIDKVFARGVRIEDLMAKTEDLENQAKIFQKTGKEIRWKMWMQNMRVKLILIALIVILVLIIWLSVCHGFKC